ncbi:MAG: glycosyltransferase family 4 protein, partial [Pseudomonadota bacterium]
MSQAESRLRIAVLNRTFSPAAGGAERYSIALVEQLAAQHEIHVFAQHINHHWPGVTYHQVSMPLRRPRWVNQLWFATATWWATRQGFDVVHSHENTWHGDVQTVHVLPVKHNLFFGRTGWRRALRWVKVLTSPRLLVYLGLERLRYAQQPGRSIVVTSDSLRAIFSRSYPQASPMTTVITPGIALPVPVTADTRQEARLALGLPPDKPCILFVGNDLRKKGLQSLLEALLLLKPELADAVLAVVGQSAQVPQFRQQAEAAGLASRVFFIGALDDVAPAYRAADCLAHPTLEDT